MPKTSFASSRHFGKVFDHVANDYDQNRLSYPDELVDHACKIGKIETGDKVLEIGCGSGQLTQSLLVRGLHVTAIEPGKKLLKLAEQKLKGLGEVEFINKQFEDVELSKRSFKAVFSASAFHWADPDVSWKKTAELLIPGGMFALLQYFGLKEQHTSLDLEMQLASLKKVVPDVAAGWPQYYSLDGIMEGVKLRRKNISEVWSWLGSYDLARSYVAHLFNNVEIAALPTLIEQTPDELIAVISTLSFYSRLSPAQRKALKYEYDAIYKKLGRSLRSSTVSILVTANSNYS